MRNPTEILEERLSDTSSRGGFLATLGKLALLGGAALAGLRAQNAFATCGPSDCVYHGLDYGHACPPLAIDSYAGCCVSGGQYYETRVCTGGGAVECYYAIASGPGCPNAPAP